MESPDVFPSSPSLEIPNRPEYDQPDSLPVSRAYSASSHQFLTRKLPQALLTISPYLSSPSVSHSWKVKIWKLYITILDTAAKAPQEEGKKIWGRGEWLRVMRLTKYNAVWDECEHAFGQNNIDLDVVIALVTVSLRHADDLRDLRRRIERYLNLDSKENVRIKSLIELYILGILAKSNDWEYAREFINTRLSSQDYRAYLLNRLNELEIKTVTEAEEKIRREKEILTESKDKQNSLFIRDSTRKSPSSEARPVSDKDGNTQLNSSAKTAREKSRPLTPSKNPLNFVSHLGQVIPGSRFSFIRTIIFIMALFGLLGRQNMRQKVLGFLKLVYGKAISTLGMGIRATYM